MSRFEIEVAMDESRMHYLVPLLCASRLKEAHPQAFRELAFNVLLKPGDCRSLAGMLRNSGDKDPDTDPSQVTRILGKIDRAGMRDLGNEELLALLTDAAFLEITAALLTSQESPRADVTEPGESPPPLELSLALLDAPGLRRKYPLAFSAIVHRILLSPEACAGLVDMLRHSTSSRAPRDLFGGSEATRRLEKEGLEGFDADSLCRLFSSEAILSDVCRLLHPGIVFPDSPAETAPDLERPPSASPEGQEFPEEMEEFAPAVTLGLEDEEALLEDALRGVSAALGTLLYHSHNTLLSYARRIIGDPEGAEDLVQDAYVIVFSRKKGTIRKNPVGFAVGIIRYLALRQLHQVRIRERSLGAEPSHMGNREAQEATETDRVISLVRSCVEKLSRLQRTLLHLRYEKSLGLKDISKIVGKHASGVCRDIKAVLKSLKRCISSQL